MRCKCINCQFVVFPTPVFFHVERARCFRTGEGVDVVISRRCHLFSAAPLPYMKHRGDCRRESES